MKVPCKSLGSPREETVVGKGAHEAVWLVDSSCSLLPGGVEEEPWKHKPVITVAINHCRETGLGVGNGLWPKSQGHSFNKGWPWCNQGVALLLMPSEGK